MRRALPFLILPLLAVCAPTASQGDQARAAPTRGDCGFEAAQRDYFARLDRGRAAASTSMRARACEPPDAEAIAVACAVREAVPAALDRGPDEPDYVMPDYQARGVRCRLVDRRRSEAYCRFQLGRVGPTPVWREVRMRFRYTFGIIADEVGHPLHLATWDGAGVCTAAEPPALD